MGEIWVTSRKFTELNELAKAIENLAGIASDIRGSEVHSDEIYVSGGLSQNDCNEIHLYKETLTDGSTVFSAKIYIS